MNSIYRNPVAKLVLCICSVPRMAPMNSSSTRHAPSFSAETLTSCSLPPAVHKDSEGSQVLQASQKTSKRICATCSVALPPCHTLQYLTFTGILFYALPFCSLAVVVLKTNLDVKHGSNRDQVTAQVSDQNGQSWRPIVNNLKSSAYM